MKNTNIFKPILFSTEMVQAILEGRKKQTRRICKIDIKPSKMYPNAWNFESKRHSAFNVNIEDLNTTFLGVLGLAKYQIGDILWVRETTYLHELWNKIIYRADNDSRFRIFTGWKPSLFMPKEAARIFLKVTNVRCERLQDISEEDAIAEGLEIVGTDREFIFYKNYQFPGEFHQVPRNSFLSLWDSINAKKYPWESNPWVWVYEFEKVEKPENWPL